MERIKHIPEGNFTGYYWMSDATDPVIVNGYLPDKLKKLDEIENPFVIEAQLFDSDRRISYSIKFIDGRYIISPKQVEESIGDVKAGKYDYISLKRYLGHRMKGRKLLFFQYWKEQGDDLCEGFPVLQPGAMAFVGFE